MGSVHRRELKYILELSIPVALGELGWIFMSVVDTIMVGPLGPAAIGAVSIGTAVIDVPVVTGIGLVLGLDTVVSQAWGAGRERECDDWLWHGLWVALLVLPLLMLWTPVAVNMLHVAGVNPEVSVLARPYLLAVNWSLPGLMLYAAVRRYLQGMSYVRPVMFTLLSANVVNALGNWLLIPRYGVEGAAWATVLARMYMGLMLVAFAWLRKPGLHRTAIGLRLAAVRRLLELGLPAAGHILLEVGVFATATVLAGRLRAEALAAHHVVLNIAATTFMVPLGISSAGAVAVGQAIGRGDPAAARRAGWMSIGLGAGFMAFAALMMVLFSGPLLGFFTDNAEVLAIGTPLIGIAVLFQIFDGTQVTATGALRGAGNTKTPMYANLVAHWLLALPVGYLLCFHFDWGVWGLWTGFCVGLITVALVLLSAWSRVRISGSHNS